MNLHFQTEGSGTPFLFIHGLGGDMQQAKELLDPLQHCQKIYVDCPGHGQSPLPDSQSASFAYFTDQIVQLMDDLQIREAVVGGSSMGSGITTRLMVHYPERLLGAVLVRPAWLDQPAPESLSILLDLAEHLRREGGKHSFQQLSSFKNLRQTLPVVADSLLGQFERPQGSAATAQLLEEMTRDAPISNLQDLQTFGKPCTVITCEPDPLHPASFGEALANHIPGAVHRQVSSRYLDPEGYISEVQQYLQSFVDR